jgi:hypothetical protein
MDGVPVSIPTLVESAVPRLPTRTEVASRCGSYFGIAEALMLAVLLLSLAQQTAVLVRLRPRSGCR